MENRTIYVTYTHTYGYYIIRIYSEGEYCIDDLLFQCCSVHALFAVKFYHSQDQLVGKVNLAEFERLTNP